MCQRARAAGTSGAVQTVRTGSTTLLSARTTSPTPPPPADVPADWLRGVLDLVVLRVVAEQATYGYAIASELADHGFGEIKGGTLYPLLGRLQQAGQVESQWRAGDGGPGRKYYWITAAGLRRLRTEGRTWTRFADLVGSLVTSDPAHDAVDTTSSAATRTTGTTTRATTQPTTAGSTAGDTAHGRHHDS